MFTALLMIGGVDEEAFPCKEKCCRKNSTAFMASYEKICPYCDISASLPMVKALKQQRFLNAESMALANDLLQLQRTRSYADFLDFS
jgi:hypothetical protein